MSEDLEHRVAELEAAMDRLLRPAATFPELTAEEAAQLKEDLSAVLRAPRQHVILPSAPPLTPDVVRQLLRESVTVVKPGEVLFLAGDPNWTPTQIREIQQAVSAWLEHNAPDVKVLVLPHGDMSVAEAPA